MCFENVSPLGIHYTGFSHDHDLPNVKGVNRLTLVIRTWKESTYCNLLMIPKEKNIDYTVSPQ